MVIRANKPAFNIREKLKELERPIGIKGSELMRAETTQEAGALLGVGRKNLCINGNFKIWQRGTSIAAGASGNSTNAYKYVTADHWQTYFYNTYERQDSVLPSGERVYSLRETFNTGRNFFVHIIEDGGRIFNQGDYVTISFWAKTSGPSTGVSLGFYWYDGPNWSNYTNTGIRTEVIIEGSEWKYYTATTQIPANANNRQHLAIEFDNNNFGGWTQLSGTDWWEFANIQIEKGKVATEFEHRSYGEELALCQRYFYKLNRDTTGSRISGAVLRDSTQAYGFGRSHPTPMRTNPTITSQGLEFYKGDVASSITPLFDGGPYGFAIDGTASSSLSATDGDAVMIHFADDNSYINFSAEL